MVATWLVLTLAPEVHAAEDFDGYTFYFGDMHAHTGVSPDGGSADMDNCEDPAVCGSLAGIFDTAKANGLDFVAFNDHTTSLATEFNAFLGEIRAANDPAGGFITIPGAEAHFVYTSGENIGHKNGYVFQDDDALLAGLSLDDYKEPEITTCSDVWTHAADLSAFGPTLLFAHHPATQKPWYTDWSCHDQTYQPIVEVYSQHGNSLLETDDYDPVDLYVSTGTVHEALETWGLKVGFVGGTDNHDSRPGEVCDYDSDHQEASYAGSLTIVQVDEGTAYSRKAIYDEMVARRTLLTTGPRMPVQVEWVLENGEVARPGRELRVRQGDATTVDVSVPTAWAPYVVDVSVIGYADTLELSSVDVGVWSLDIGNEDLPSWLYVQVEIDGELYYGTDCIDGGTDQREFVWSSPDWFELTDDVDLDGEIYTTDCNDDDASVNPSATEVYYDGVDQNCDGGSDFDADTDGVDSDVYGGTDCDDKDGAILPGALETWYDGTDSDCDGHSDFDVDFDGVDSALYGGTDCDDGDATAYLGATEIWYDGVDQDCDGLSDFDSDRDGVDSAAHAGTDCDDGNETAFPGAVETWYDGTDSDCDGQSDIDADFDGFGALDHGGTDCADADPAIHLGAAEIWYDGVDQDCNGRSDFDQDEDGADALAYGGADCDDEDASVVTCDTGDTGTTVDTGETVDSGDPTDTGIAETGDGSGDDGAGEDDEGDDGKTGCGCWAPAGPVSALFLPAMSLLVLTRRRNRRDALASRQA